MRSAFTVGDAMPRKPLSPCSYPGCVRFAVRCSSLCEEHLKQERKRYNKYERDDDFNKRYGRSWRKVREHYVSAHPLCESCLKDGRLVPVEEVHHIVPLSQGGTNDDENLMSLCRSCHQKMHRELGDR